MAETLTDLFTGSIQIRMQYSRVDTQEVGSVTNRANTSTAYQITDGSGEFQADLVYAATRETPPNGFDYINFLNLEQLTLEVPVPFAFTRIRVIRIVNHATHSDGYLYVGARETNPNAFAWAIGPESELFSINAKQAWLVNAGNGNVPLYNPSGTPVPYTVYAIGSSQ